MKRKELAQLHQKTKEELKKSLKDLEEELLKLVPDWSIRKVKNSNILRQKKKDIARILTILETK